MSDISDTPNIDDAVSALELDFEKRKELFEEYSSDLKTYLKFLSANKKNPNIRQIQTYYLYRLVERWQPLLGFNETVISSHIVDIQTPRLEYKTSLSIKDVMQETDISSSWLVPGLLQSCGMYILGGDPKTGKSVLAYALCYSVCVSGEFLGLPAKQGNVLYLQLEEPLPTIKKRFKKVGFGNIDKDEQTSLVVNFQDNRLRIERQFDITTDINWLIQRIEEYDIDLVIVDSLRKATNKSNYSENSNEFGKLVYSLQQVFNITNTCGVVIHHLSKTGADQKRAHNLIERLAGHTSISAASDGLIGLFDTSTPQQEQLTLKTKPRDGFSMSLSYQRINSPEGLWEFKSLGTDGPAKLVATSQILRCLSQNPDEYISTKELANKLKTNITSNDFLSGIQYLVDLELIHSRYVNKHCYYSFPIGNMWMVNPVTIQSLVSAAVIDANHLILCRNKSEIRNLVTEWSTSRKKDAFHVLLPDEQKRINDLIVDWEFSIGDKVTVPPSLDIYEISNRIGEPTSLNKNLYEISNDDSIMYEVEEVQLKKVIVEDTVFEIDEDSIEEEGIIQIPEVMRL